MRTKQQDLTAVDSPITRRRRRLISPITRRILAINVLALGFLGAGILYLDQYKENLIQTELAGLVTQAEMFAVALSEGAVARSPSGQYRVSKIPNQMVRRLVKTTGVRARLFGVNGLLVADSRRLVGSGGFVSIEILPPPKDPENPLSRAFDLFERAANHISGAESYPIYTENSHQHARDYDEVLAALSGDYVKAVRSLDRDHLMLAVAVPVQRYKQVLGGLLITKDSKDIDEALYETRRDILKVFAVALALTVLLSIYLAGTIARPLRRLALAAERVRHDHSRRHRIPGMADRDDEIGELAATLNDMTDALWKRMDAIDHFAADVAHEIKNPLTSLRSAVETAARLKDSKQQQKLMGIIQDDVGRLDRLISDISEASRIDAELSRAESEPTDIAGMLAFLAEIQNTTGSLTGQRVVVSKTGGADPLMVSGIESRLAQVFRNLITNAATFSPSDSVITITISAEPHEVCIEVDDEGPGIRIGNEEKIFQRFYTERADSEKFGTHSGLGLSISEQIIEAHHGKICGGNRFDAAGNVLGARFTVRLPLT